MNHKIASPPQLHSFLDTLRTGLGFCFGAIVPFRYWRISLVFFLVKSLPNVLLGCHLLFLLFSLFLFLLFEYLSYLKGSLPLPLLSHWQVSLLIFLSLLIFFRVFILLQILFLFLIAGHFVDLFKLAHKIL